jgi:hypothetical protein
MKQNEDCESDKALKKMLAYIKEQRALKEKKKKTKHDRKRKENFFTKLWEIIWD